jgi:hypothetical protein
MDGVEVAEATAATVSGLSSGFMLDLATYVAGAAQGFAGLDFYYGGRAGVLGDVRGDVVAAAMVFFHPDLVRAQWDAAVAVMPPADASAVFAECEAKWADDHLGADVDWQTLADLAGKVVGAATPAGAPLFAAWRSVDAPGDARQAALHQLNCLRELRLARHGAAVLATGLDIGDAVRHRSPHMISIFGWDDQPVADEVSTRWAEAERLTNQGSGRDYAVLSDDEAGAFVRLCAEATASVS